ncbi:MAG TPA: homoserine kinase [Acidimicrobiales bacterium]|nr:homoserine kinase [Acidimicrobiales bacterium]
MRVRAPASSANLGPGFDTLAVALECYVSVEVEPAPSLRVHTEGEGASLFDDASHLAARVVAEVLGHERFSVSVRSQIPLARGLGSSAALAAAAAAAAGADDPFAIAAAHDGHPENAAASVFGGLVAATAVEGRPVYAPLPLSSDLTFVVVVPERNLSTPEARRVLPESLSRADVVFNLGRMGLLLAGLADPDHLAAAATEDRLHQPARGALFPEAGQILRGLIDAGALAACWSGAGPALVGIAREADASRVRDGAEQLLADTGIPGRVLAVGADRRGIVHGEDAEVPL